MASWGLLADLSFSDLLLYVPLDEYSLAVARPPTSVRSGGAAREEPGSLLGLHFVVLGQMRPGTNQTLFELDLVGEVVEAGELPYVTEAWRTGDIFQAQRRPTPDPMVAISRRSRSGDTTSSWRCWCALGRPVPGGEVAVSSGSTSAFSSSWRRWSVPGLYPFLADDAEVEGAPRVGDGVLVLNAGQRITFASPNAVNALHRMGIVSSIVGSSMTELGIDTDAVSLAFERRLPVIEEIERRGDVIVMLRCIPLIARR